MSRSAPSAVIERSAALDALAKRVQRRVFARATLDSLKRSAWVPWVSLPLVALLHRWLRPEAIALGTLGLWSTIALAAAWRSRRTTYGALADWDAAGGRCDAISSALVFAHDASVSNDPGRLLHLERSDELVAAASERLPVDLPLPRLRWTWLGAGAAIAFALLPWWHRVVALGDQALSDDQRAAAAAQGMKLNPADNPLLEKMNALTEEERRALEALARSQEELAASLKNAEGKSPRELLDELENQARAAESLAQQLGTDANAWASEKLLAELRQHPDTADIAEAVLSKQPAQVAAEARITAATLKNPQVTSEVAERLKNTLSQSLAKADPAERGKPVDHAVAAAEQHLQSDQPIAAGEAFDALAESFDRLNERDKAREELEKMAQRLREAGSSIMGQRGEGMKKLAGQSAPTSASAMPSLQPLSAAGDPSDLTGSFPLPGASMPRNINPDRSAPRRGTPIPGTGQLPKDAKPLDGIPGTGPPGARPLALATPIPGTNPGRATSPMPGAGTGSQGPPASGGSQPGRGSTESGRSPTELTAAAAQGEVAAASGLDGESFTQSIDGQPREENSSRAARPSAAAFLKEAERALDTENLPPSRREHIRRYFESLRKQVGE